MKKNIILLTLGLLLFGCGATPKQFDDVMNRVYVGMSLSEFNQIEIKKELVVMSEEATVYKIVSTPWYDHDGADGTWRTRFFYFKNNKLSQVDEGERATDLKIEIKKTSN